MNEYIIIFIIFFVIGYKEYQNLYQRGFIKKLKKEIKQLIRKGIDNCPHGEVSEDFIKICKPADTKK